MICLFVSPAFSHFCLRQMSISSSDTRSPGLLQQRAGDHGAIAGCARWILPRPPGALRAPRGVAWCVACAAGARDDPRRADCHGADGAGHGQPQGLGGAAVAAGIACVAEVQSTWRNRGLQHTSDSKQVRPNGSDGLSESLVPCRVIQHGHGTSPIPSGKSLGYMVCLV